MTTALVASPAQTMLDNTRALGETLSLFKAMAEANCMPAKMKPAEAMLCAAQGAAYGWNPIQSCQRFHVVKGNVVMKADVMVGVAKAHPDCEYFMCVEHSDERATYETKRRGSPRCERVTFTMGDAQRAGVLSNSLWKKYPAQMLRARASSALVRMVYSDAIAGIYTPDEVGRPDIGFTPEGSDIIDAQVIETSSHHALQPERVRQSTPPQRQKPTAAAEVGTYEWLARRVRRAALEVPLNAYFRAKEADPDKAQTLESIRAWNSTDRWSELAEQIAAALPANLNAPRVAYDTAKLHLSKVLGRQAEAAEISALMQRVREACEGVAELSARNLALACCLLAARCVRKPQTLHLRLGLPKVGE